MVDFGIEPALTTVRPLGRCRAPNPNARRVGEGTLG